MKVGQSFRVRFGEGDDQEKVEQRVRSAVWSVNKTATRQQTGKRFRTAKWRHGKTKQLLGILVWRDA